MSLKLKPSGREMLGGPANVIVAEKPKPQKEDYGDFMSWRPDRTRLASSSDFAPTITVSSGPLALDGGGRRVSFMAAQPAGE